VSEERKCAYASKSRFKVHCGSAFAPGASRPPYYYTPPVCVPGVLGALTVWRHTQKKNLEKSNHNHTFACNEGQGLNTKFSTVVRHGEDLGPRPRQFSPSDFFLGCFFLMGIGPCGPPPLEWISYPPLVTAVLITFKGAESPGSRRIGVVGALVNFFPPETVGARGGGPMSPRLHWIGPELCGQGEGSASKLLRGDSPRAGLNPHRLMTPTTDLGLSIRLSMFELRETGDWTRGTSSGTSEGGDWWR